MTLNANSYGTSAKVATRSRWKATSGDFDASTNPTKETVEQMINEISGLLNGYAKTLGFTPPFTNTDNVFAVEGIVVSIVAALIDADVRGTGKYAPSSKAVASRGQMSAVIDDIRASMDMLAEGFEADETYSQPNDFKSRSPIRSDGYSDSYTVIET